jgi:transposase
MFYASSRLLTAYSLKEQSFLILDSADSKSARAALSHWMMVAQNNSLSKFVGCGNTMVRW